MYEAETCVAMMTQSIMDAQTDAVPNQRSKDKFLK